MRVRGVLVMLCDSIHMIRIYHHNLSNGQDFRRVDKNNKRSYD